MKSITVDGREVKRVYMDTYERCSAALVKHDEEEWEIQSVWTKAEYRGKGLMRALMKRILDDADREGIVIILTSGIGRESGLSTGQLTDWYARLGFDAIAVGSYAGTTIMQRVPRSGEGEVPEVGIASAGTATDNV